MTEEEAINDIIDMVKNGVNNPLDVYCDSYPCSTCPFHNDENGECAETMISGLIERLLKAEEHQETNFDHYIIRNGVHITKEHDVEVWEFRFKKGTEKQFFDANIKSVLDWLLSPYEEPKPTYKLTQFEYDLLEYHSGSKFGFKDFWILEHMQSKGYFKDIPNDVPIRDILENCEVVD